MAMIPNSTPPICAPMHNRKDRAVLVAQVLVGDLELLGPRCPKFPVVADLYCGDQVLSTALPYGITYYGIDSPRHPLATHTTYHTADDLPDGNLNYAVSLKPINDWEIGVGPALIELSKIAPRVIFYYSPGLTEASNAQPIKDLLREMNVWYRYACTYRQSNIILFERRG